MSSLDVDFVPPVGRVLDLFLRLKVEQPKKKKSRMDSLLTGYRLFLENTGKGIFAQYGTFKGNQSHIDYHIV